jgi:hypothetical protein
VSAVIDAAGFADRMLAALDRLTATIRETEQR